MRGATSHAKGGMASILRRFRDDVSGATSIEYSLITVFIAIAIIGSVSLIGGRLAVLFSDVRAAFAN